MLVSMAGGGRATRTVVAPSDRPLTDEEKCGGTSTRTGKPCRKRRGAGTDHPGYGNCNDHGGCTEAGIKFAAREMGRDLLVQYKSSSARFGGDRRDPAIATLTPEQALVEEVRRSAAMVRFLEERISYWGLDLSDQTVTAFMKFVDRPERQTRAAREFNRSMRDQVREFLHSLDEQDPSSPHYLPELVSEPHPNTGTVAFTNAREWLLIYREERAHLARVSKMALDSGVAQRLVTIAEDQGRILASALRLTLSALNLTPEQEARIPVIVPPILRAAANDQPLPSLDSLLGVHPDQKALD